MPEAHKVSFARNPAANPAQPVQAVQAVAPAVAAAPSPVAQSAPAPTIVPEVVAPQGSPAQVAAPAVPVQNLPATQGTPGPLGFYTGSDEEEYNSSLSDERMPRLNIVQPTSGPDFKAIAPEGNWVYKRTLALPSTIRIVIGGFQPKIWVEKLPFPRPPNAPAPRIARTEAEVAAFGGVSVWKFSRENKDKATGMPLYAAPLFDSHVTAGLLIAIPEGFDDANFPYVSDDGIAFAPALITLKSTSFGSFFVPINSERKFSFRGNFASRYVDVAILKSQNNPSFFPKPTIASETSPAVQALARKVFSS